MKSKEKKLVGIFLALFVLKILLDGLALYIWDKTPADMLAELLHTLF